MSAILAVLFVIGAMFRHGEDRTLLLAAGIVWALLEVATQLADIKRDMRKHADKRVSS
jgi:hypothetical protein